MCVYVCDFSLCEILLDSVLSMILDGIGRHFRHIFYREVHFECISEYGGIICGDREEGIFLLCV